MSEPAVQSLEIEDTDTVGITKLCHLAWPAAQQPLLKEKLSWHFFIFMYSQMCPMFFCCLCVCHSLYLNAQSIADLCASGCKLRAAVPDVSNCVAQFMEIPDLEAEEDMSRQVAAAPAVRSASVMNIAELESEDLFRLPVVDKDHEVDLSLLTACLCPADEVRQPRTQDKND